MTTQSSATHMPILFRGEPVANRQDCEDSIARIAREKGISADEAWLRYQKQTLAFLEASAGSGSHSPAPSKPAASATSKRTTDIGALSSMEGEGFGDLTQLSDDMVPEHLRGSGVSVMDALSNGSIKLKGEHPLSDALRDSLIEGREGDEAKAKIARQLGQESPMQLSLLLPGRQAVRVMPSDFSKTSLFHATSNNVARRYCRNELLGQVGNQVTIFYQGEELRQTDEAIFRELIYVARGREPWEWITLNQCHFRDAKGMQQYLSGRQNNEIHEVLMRLRAAVLTIKSNKRNSFITCNLLRDYEGSGSDRRVRIDPRLIVLFDSYAALDEVVLLTLTGLSQKLYEYIAGIPHAILHPINLTSLFELCYGRKQYLEAAYLKDYPGKTEKQAQTAIAKKFSDFIRKNLPNALKSLRDEKNVIVSFEIDYSGSKVYIAKNTLTTIEAKEFSLDS